ncbi:hypothetical protein TL16_g04168 [Triparma laevis f. inornata]|uniref:Uncharacterized protein n=1 Tax=Triparma laevis f. inornata TaxID=1714386 RepID=A0A9W7A9X1_9STRA|nr:hypothetical protein TL16_g04168 [Triparma laevis f. inornata]
MWCLQLLLLFTLATSACPESNNDDVDFIPVLSTLLSSDLTLTQPIQVATTSIHPDGNQLGLGGRVAQRENCWNKLKKYTRIMMTDGVAQSERVLTISKYYLRCARGIPYNEYILELGALSDDPASLKAASYNYLNGLTTEAQTLHEYYDIQRKEISNPETGIYEIPTLDRRVSPTRVGGKGNYYLTTIAHLEHHADQLEYLSFNNKLPSVYLEVVAAIRHVVVPQVARSNVNSAEPGVPCIYVSPRERVDCIDKVRQNTFLLAPWMIDLMRGTFNRLIYMPKALPRSYKNPFCLNPDLDYKTLEDRYLEGDVLQIDKLMTDVCLSELRRFAQEGTIFYDFKKSYFGAYLDEGVREFDWINILISEFRERFPRVIGDMNLSTAWFYKYDSLESHAGGIGIHADQAAVNINIWLTEEDANLDKSSGGLVIYDTAPPQDEVYDDEKFFVWNQDIMEGFREKWLNEHGAKNVTVPYKENRAAVFDSKRLHATDAYHFKLDYTKRRINLTLLFGDGRNQEGETSEVVKMSNRLYKNENTL